jgi:hypothetical protein
VTPIFIIFGASSSGKDQTQNLVKYQTYILTTRRIENEDDGCGKNVVYINIPQTVAIRAM